MAMNIGGSPCRGSRPGEVSHDGDEDAKAARVSYLRGFETQSGVGAMARFGLWAAAAVMAGAASPAAAADITWTAPMDETGSAADVVADGRLVGAVTAGPNTRVNGVKFIGQTSAAGGSLQFAASPITVSNVSDNYAQYGAAPAGWDGGYRLLVGGGAFAQTPTPTTITISGLAAGHRYEVQIFEAFWNSNWATTFTGGQKTSGAVNLAGPAVDGAAASATPQYVIGSFTADWDSQTIVLGSATGYEIFDAMQIRDLGVATEGR
jgi:hypothetical protein